MREKLKANVVATFTNLEALGEEIGRGCDVDYDTLVDFFELIDMHVADSVFTDKVRERFADL